MANFILVHGGLHGGWCWERVVPLLEASGHDVHAPDLPGADRAVPAAGISLQTYADAILALAERAREPVIAVAHSLGGRSVSLAADQRPDLFAALVYVTALIPEADGCPPAFTVTEDNVVRNGFYPADDGAAVMIGEAAAREGFYSDCNEADILAALGRLVPQPNGPMTDPAHISERRWGRIPRHYVLTLADRTIPPDAQRAMATAVPGARLHELPCGHSPFYTHPRELASILLAAASAHGS